MQGKGLLASPHSGVVLAFAGKYMARTIALIRSASHEDIEPANGWTQAEKHEAARTQVYLIGGGMGASEVGSAIMRNAADALHALGIHDIALLRMGDGNISARAAAAML